MDRLHHRGRLRRPRRRHLRLLQGLDLAGRPGHPAFGGRAGDGAAGRRADAYRAGRRRRGFHLAPGRGGAPDGILASAARAHHHRAGSCLPARHCRFRQGAAAGTAWRWPVSVLKVQDLAKSFGGVRAVQGVSFTVEAGELLALIGPNGAGKTTCFNMLNGQLRPDQGEVELGGESIRGLAPREIWRKGVGRTFQITATFASMTVIENVQMALVSHDRRTLGLFARTAGLYRKEALSLLDLVGMADQSERPCGVLAYGDLKRVELAVALANGPRLLLMDEPTAGMAPQERIALMALTAEIVRARNIAVLFTEHDMDVVFAHADRIIVLNRGELIAEGAPEAVRANARVQQVYLGSGGHH
ncbi:MAG: ABC transporter ATP-binding protein [Alphaproteobacteria bacterium]|nr:ABC transporter ATP-binding protein [Alphaproteobacteria bacterium]